MEESITVFVIVYILFCLCILFPPTEFIAAGLTVTTIFNGYLGEESADFVGYHIRRSVVNIIAHCCLPAGFLVVMVLCDAEGFEYLQSRLWVAWPWQLFSAVAIVLPLAAILIVTAYLRPEDWARHPLAANLAFYDAAHWRRAALSLNAEYRRLDKFVVNLGGWKRIIVTDSWIVSVGSYWVRVSHQAESQLLVTGSDEHCLSPASRYAVQFVNIRVQNTARPIRPFCLRMSSADYRELKTKVQAPLEIARDVIIHLTMDEKFVQAFADHVQTNPRCVLNPDAKRDLDACIGCMRETANVKLQKYCSDDEPEQVEEGEDPPPSCGRCYCRPMWCVSCMGRWFASRQKQNRPETWLSGKSPCPTCRTFFCVLDVCLVE